MDSEPTCPRRVVLIDDLRSFVDGRVAQVARTSAAGVELVRAHRSERIDELWLDHDLGGDDTIWPVVAVLEEAAFGGHPYNIGCILVHSANPPGAEALVRVLRRWGYDVRAVSGSPEVAHLPD